VAEEIVDDCVVSELFYGAQDQIRCRIRFFEDEVVSNEKLDAVRETVRDELEDIDDGARYSAG